MVKKANPMKEKGKEDDKRCANESPAPPALVPVHVP